MILGLCAIVIGNVFVWGADEETTQFFSGWVIGILAIIMAPSVPRIPRIVLTSIACVYVVLNEQKLTTPTAVINCVNGDTRVVGGDLKCVCTPPYIGDSCNVCPPGAINEGNETHDICYTCKHQYMFPHCTNLLPGYQNETMCYDRWVPSCKNDNSISLAMFYDKTYDNVEGIRNLLYDASEHVCINEYNGTVYCDKCKDGHAGPDCCPDGKYGQGCSKDVPLCSGDLDYHAKLQPNIFPIGYTLVDPQICYNSSCTCGGEFIGDSLCASNFCINGKCADMSRVQEYRFRCQCDVGVGPDCVTNPCYGGTRMWAGKGICRCNAKHTNSFEGMIFDACEKQTDGKCYPDLFGESCKECQCAVDIKHPFNTSQCPKTHYGVFERDFRTKEFVETDDHKCMVSGTCTNEPDDCGDVDEGADRCTLFTNPQSFSAILFSGDNCTDTKDSKCRVWEPCRPR
jgi:hypothetical protein